MKIPAENITDLLDAIPDATPTTAGLLPLATTAEVALGEDPNKAITPQTLADGLPFTTYTPVLYGNSTAWTIGNGTVVGSLVWINPKAITVSATVTIGSTSTVPAGAMRITLPYPPRLGTGRHHGAATVYTNAWAEYVATVRTAAGQTYVEFMQAPAGYLTDASPRAITATDVLAFTITYPVD
jgi:hypothetical protein